MTLLIKGAGRVSRYLTYTDQGGWSASLFFDGIICAQSLGNFKHQFDTYSDNNCCCIQWPPPQIKPHYAIFRFDSGNSLYCLLLQTLSFIYQIL